MENKNPIFSIKNFRSFGEEGADFELAPITVLTGCNSAGKSSLVKAILLLAEQECKPPIEIEPHQFDDLYYNTRESGSILRITTSDLKLGGFGDVLHKSNLGASYLELSYKIYSFFLQEKVIVKRIYTAFGDDDFKEGICTSFVIEKEDGTAIYDRGRRGFQNEFAIVDGKKFHQLAILKNIKKDYYLFEDRNEQIKRNYNKDFVNEGEVISVLPKDERDACIIWDKLKDIMISPITSRYGKEWGYIDMYATMIYLEVTYPFFLREKNYITSESANIERWYSLSENDKMNRTLRNAYNHVLDSNWRYRPFSFCNEWIRKFGIGKGIELKRVGDVGGVTLYLWRDTKKEILAEYKSNSQYDKHREPEIQSAIEALLPENGKRLLADEGYGITQLLSLLLNIELHISDDRSRPKYICVEEPEVHLHPKYQSMLAEMFVEAYQKYNIRFIIETHSEYLIRKLQVMVADKECELNPSEVSINYVDKGDDGAATNRRIEILEDGSLSEDFGTGFFDEADNLAINLFRFKKCLQ